MTNQDRYSYRVIAATPNRTELSYVLDAEDRHAAAIYGELAIERHYNVQVSRVIKVERVIF